MNKYVIIIALVNGMIGGLILVLPILAMYGGTILSLLVILVTGFFSFYSCYLCIIHLGQCPDLDKAILEHFGQSKVMRIFYDFLVFFNLLFLLMLYFNLIVTQWRGLLPYNIANPICNAAGLLVLTFVLNYFHFGAKLLGYGIVSIIGYCIFLVWLISTAPSGPNRIPNFGKGAVNLAASMGQAFSIQAFFIPVLRQLPESSKYVKYTLIAYLIGGTVYLYIAFAGSFGIINRQTVPIGIIPETIQNYFSRGQWQVAIVEVIYLIHLYSAYGQFLLICKKRFFNIFGVKESKHGQILNVREIVFVVVLILITVGIYFGNVGIGTLIQINGAILGFFFIYLLPAAMHFVCLYMPGKKKDVIQLDITRSISKPMLDNDRSLITDESHKHQMIQMTQKSPSSQPASLPAQQFSPTNRQTFLQPHQSPLQQQQPKHPHSKPQQSLKSHQQPQIQIQRQRQRQETSSKNMDMKLALVSFSCTCTRPRPALQVLDVISMLGMVGLGAFIMVDGFISVITGQ